VIEKRMARYSADEIHFNLMAIVSDMRGQYQRRIDELVSAGMDTDDVATEVSRLQSLIADEELKRTSYRIENIRRRHNYLPFIVELLKILSEEGKLVELTEKAREKAGEKRTREKEKKEAKAAAEK